MRLKLISAVRDHLALQCLLLCLALLCVFALTGSGVDTSEAFFHYSVAQQIIRYGELGFAAEYGGPFAVAPDGRTYASHEIGNTLFLLPVAFLNEKIESRFVKSIGAMRVAMITKFLMSAMGAVLGAAGAVLLYLILRLVYDKPIQNALAGVLLICFCSFYWSYTRIIFDGVLCGILLLGAMLCLFLFARRRTTWLLVVGFACLGFGFITRLTMVLAIAAAGIYLLFGLGLRVKEIERVAVLAGLTLAPFVAWQLYYNHLRTGNPFLGAVQLPKYAINNGLNGNMIAGLAGLLASPGKSIFVYCPPVLISVFLISRFWRKSRTEAIFIVALGTFWFLLHAKLNSWYGAWGWGPRHFFTIAPALALPFAVERETVRSWAARASVAVLLAFGCLLASASIVGSWLYRMELASLRGGLEDASWIWSLTKSQSVDAIRGAARSLHTLFFGADYLVVPGASSATIVANNTVNVWWHSAYSAGISPLLILTAVSVLVVCAFGSLLLLFHAGLYNPTRSDTYTPTGAASANR